MGDGFPVAALIIREEITNRLTSDGIDYFNTYGGNPVSCRAGIVKTLARKYESIGDVRGRRLFLGIEIVHNHKKREPDTNEVEEIKQ
ncbi:unnamed protein product, partial [Rotaria sordida]